MTLRQARVDYATQLLLLNATMTLTASIRYAHDAVGVFMTRHEIQCSKRVSWRPRRKL